MNAWCLTLTVFVKTSVQMQREQHTFSGLLFLNQGNSNWDCFSVIIMWLTLRHYRTHNSCIFSVIAPSKMWATNPGSVNDTLQDENLLPSVFFRLQIRQFCARRIWCLSPYHIQSKSHCNLNAVFRSTASFFFFFFAVFIPKLQYKSATRGGMKLSEMVFQTKQIIWACLSFFLLFSLLSS